MRMQYRISPLPREQRLYWECILLHEMEEQTWFDIAYFRIWKTPALIMIQ